MRKHSIIYGTLLLLLFLQPVTGQQNTAFENIIGKLTSFAANKSPEKTFIQTDKDFYINGETIWLKTYAFNGVTHTISDKSNLIYVELLNAKDSILAQRKLFVSEDGANGDIVIPDNIETGSYVLRAYTKYMLNDENPVIFQKNIPIWGKQNDLKYTSNDAFQEKNEIAALKTKKPVVQFFPEGGDLVIGIHSKLGIKVTDEEGNGLIVSGKIFNQKDVMVTVFKSYELGLSFVSFKPEPNTDYYLQIKLDGNTLKYPIPKPLLKGYTLRVLNMGEYLKIRVSTNITNGLEGTLLIGHLRGDIIFKQILKDKDEKIYNIKLLTSKLRDGVAHFTLFTSKGEPVCERLVFIENPENSLNLSVKTDRENYGFREKVNVNLILNDNNEEPLDGDFSMSVVTQKGLQKDTESLKSWLLLNSDLGGTIADPNFFFQEKLKNRKFLLDLLMLTHGWRRFTWQSFMKDGTDKELNYQPEKGIMINGYTTSFNNEYQPKKTLTTLNLLTTNEINQKKKMTNAQGKFSFGPFFFQDSISTILTAHIVPESKKKNDQVSIYLDPPFPNAKVENHKKRQISKTTTTVAQDYLKEAQLKKFTDFKYDPKITQLKEVVVKSKKKTQKELINKKLKSRTLYSTPSNRVILDSVPWMQSSSNALDLVRSIPGVHVSGAPPNQSVQIRGAANFSGPISPLFLLNGAPVQLDFIETIPVFDILFIDVLKGAQASIYGSQASGGVIAVYTRNGESFENSKKNKTPGVTNAIIPGFYKTREFYKPNYALAIPDHRKPDLRTTLHWEPSVQIKNGELSKLNFYTGDTAGKYSIRVEGITFDGRPVHKLYNFNIAESPN